jgi:hypothetical protein
MKNQHSLLISREILLPMAIAGFFITLLGAMLKITHCHIGFFLVAFCWYWYNFNNNTLVFSFARFN